MNEKRRKYQREYMRKWRAGEIVVGPIDKKYEGLNWQPIENWPGYEVSDTGLVKSVKRTMTRSNGRMHTTPERVLKLGTDTQGYRQFYPYKNGKRPSVLVHKVVFETFHRSLAAGEEVDHKDSDQTNNAAKNLQAVTRLEHARLTKQRTYDTAYRAGYVQALNEALLAKSLRDTRGE